MDCITDIISSVPYHFGWHLQKKEQLILKDPSLSGFVRGDDEKLGLKGLAGYFLTWPLSCIISQDFTTDSQRAWSIGRLRYIGDELGVKYAHILADVSHPKTLSALICLLTIVKKLQIRIPSMLIRRDGLLAAPYPMAYNFEKLLSAGCGPPTAGLNMGLFQQHGRVQNGHLEQRKEETTKKTLARKNERTDWGTGKWLVV